MTEEKFKKIMKDDDIECIIGDIEENNALMGLNLITKYLPKSGIEAAEHAIIYGPNIEDLVEAGITEEDAIILKSLNWMIDEFEGLSCFV